MKYTELAKHAPHCMECQADNYGQVVLAHFNILAWGSKFGRGIKGCDLFGAFLCDKCHDLAEREHRKDGDWWKLPICRSLTWAEQYIEFKKS